jgi:hypothetical protein
MFKIVQDKHTNVSTHKLLFIYWKHSQLLFVRIASLVALIFLAQNLSAEESDFIDHNNHLCGNEFTIASMENSQHFKINDDGLSLTKHEGRRAVITIGCDHGKQIFTLKHETGYIWAKTKNDIETGRDHPGNSGKFYLRAYDNGSYALMSAKFNSKYMTVDSAEQFSLIDISNSGALPSDLFIFQPLSDNETELPDIPDNETELPDIPDTETPDIPDTEIPNEKCSGGDSDQKHDCNYNSAGSPKGNLKMRYKGGSWISVGCENGKPVANNSDTKWYRVKRQLRMEGSKIRLYCGESNKPCKCSKTKAENFHGLSHDYQESNALSNAVDYPGGGFIFPNNGHQYCLGISDRQRPGEIESIRARPHGNKSHSHKKSGQDHKECPVFCLGSACPK